MKPKGSCVSGHFRTSVHRTHAMIPGVNDDEEHIRAVLAFMRPHRNVIDYQLLPYHRFGKSKYGFLGGCTSWKISRRRPPDGSPAPGDHRRRVWSQQHDGRGGDQKTAVIVH
jgi:hypothetical protein